MFIEWDDKYSTNINELDSHHKKMFELINIFYDARLAKKDEKIVHDILKELVNYARFHFDSEENYLKDFDFPEYEMHKKQHDFYVSKIFGLKAKLKIKDDNVYLEIMKFLKAWWIEHILNTDQKYGPFLNNKGIY